jgi:hypothetical protein
VILYVVQCSYGGIIHFYKSTKATRRPPQNYGHAVLGLLIIALSFWQVYTGLNKEWKAVGGSYVPTWIWTWWKVWVVVSTRHCCNMQRGLMPLQMIPILYLIGLGLLPRQWQQEAKQRSARRTPNVISNPRLQLNRFGV